MPIHEYRCPDGHTVERLTKMGEQLGAVLCECGELARLVMSVPAKRTDGIYSYAPNLGDPNKFERMRAGEQP